MAKQDRSRKATPEVGEVLTTNEARQAESRGVLLPMLIAGLGLVVIGFGVVYYLVR